MKINACPVCGWKSLKGTPYESVNELRQSFEICDCCGCEYGHDDNEASYREWVSNGCKWFNEKAKPKAWVLENQLQFQLRPWPPTKNEI